MPRTKTAERWQERLRRFDRSRMTVTQFCRNEGVSSEAAKKATGHDWTECKSILDKAGAEKWNHKEVVA